jgi:outer membrane protein assembly factor BamB
VTAPSTTRRVLAARWLGLTVAVGLAGAAALACGAIPGAAAAPSPPVGARSWTVYHQDAAGTGVAKSVTAVDTMARAWTSPVLDGELYGEPLVSAGRVYVATENDTVYALSSGTGAVIWSRHLGTPVPSGDLPCGDISPTVGITGTPVIDQARGEIFVVADIVRNDRPAHLLFGLRTTSGASEMSRDVDPAGADPAALLQRTGLTLDAGQVVFAFGGNFGDCASYRGRVVAVPEKGGQPRYFTVDAAAGESQGAIWMGGAAPVVDASGHIWVSVGNGSVNSSAHPYDDSDSALELSSSLRLLSFFAPSTWASNNSQDLDLSTAPVLLPDDQVLVTGKSRIVYLLNGKHPGGIGGQEATLPSACSEDIDGGSAVVGATAYLPCLSGIVAVRAAKSPAGLHVLWSSGRGGGPPVVAAGLVWTIGQNGELYGLDPATGQVRQLASIGIPANHFPTPSVAGGYLMAASASRVVAFAASPAAAPVTPAAPATSTPAASAATSAASTPRPTASHPGSQPAAAVAAEIVGGLVVVAAAGWFLWRRRRTGGR